jgi:hypothetical protein
MTNREKIENLENFIKLAQKWLELNNAGLDLSEKQKQYKNTEDLLALQWGTIEEIFKSLDIAYVGEVTRQRIKEIKATQGDLFIDGFIGADNFSDQIKNLQKLKSLALSARGKIEGGEVIPKNILPNMNLIVSILNSFPDMVSKFKNRRAQKNPFTVDDEYDVQDIVYAMLKGAFPTLQAENPNKKVGATFSVSDFTIDDLGLFIETKFIGERKQVKSTQEECKQDMVSYSKQLNCQKIIFLIYDPDKYIDNEYAFKNGLGTKIGDENKEVDIYTLVIR